ncbi:MAG: gliding motility-associated ABC transporter substrate-binding protein GldG [Chitinophagaceae bacterium]
MKKQHTVRLALLGIGLLLVNIIGSQFHHRFDLTAEKRFSISEPTKELLRSLKDDITIEVYLTGKLPAGFQQLSEGTREVLNEFKEYGGSKIRFSYVSPLEGKNEQEKEAVFKSLTERGIQPVNLKIQQDAEDGYSEKIIFPAASVSGMQKQEAVNLLENHIAMTPDEKLNLSKSLLEYKFATAIKQLLLPGKRQIAYLQGQGEAIGINTIDMLTTLSRYYDIDTIDINQNIEIGKNYRALIVCKPSVSFDEKNKFKIDQYVMNGGKVLWMIDPLKLDIDSLKKQDATLAIDYNLNLDDLLFRFGARINSDLIEDYMYANPIPITVGMTGNQPDVKLFPWLYFPFSIPDSKHPIVNNMDAVMFSNVSSIDTIVNPEISKTVLLHSSTRSRRSPSPVRISLASIRYKPQAEMFRERNIPMAVLLEGKFKSIYTNRIDPGFLSIYQDSLKKTFMPECEKTNSMIVVSDADIFLNDFSEKRGPMECGYYKYSDQMFANKTFILNALEYLTDDYGLIVARNKTLQLRLLDKVRIKKEKIQWQLLNVALPIASVLIFASAYFFFRRKKYEGRVA